MGTEMTEMMSCGNKQAVWLTTTSAVLHFLVDGLCLCCLYLTSLGFAQMMTIFVTYNVCAFLTQPLTGWLADRLKQRHWMLMGADVLLTVAVMGAGVVASIDNSHTAERLMVGVATLLGAGNSLFHVWGGKQVALCSGNDIRALGVFVSTGAFGLAIGAVCCSWALLYVFLLLICLLSQCCIKTEVTERVERQKTDETRPAGWSKGLVGGCVTALMLVVAMRAFIGESYTTGIVKTPLLLLTLGAVAMLGKMAGGWLARGLSRVKGMSIAKAFVLMLVGALLCLWGKELHLAVALLGLLLINCTMPITLYWANKVLKGKEGLAFGLLAAALMPGYLLATATTEGSELMLQLLVPLVPTILIELGVLWLLLERRKRVLLSSVAVNVLTNVPLNLYILFVNDEWTDILIGEVVVCAVEALWYLAFTRNLRQALAYSFLCNAISFLIGLLFQLICYSFT